MQERQLGKTGYKPKIISLGGESLLKGSSPEEHAEARKLIHRALDLGVNYIDTAPAYDDSEMRIGEVIADGRRNEFYLATKTDKRTAKDAFTQLTDSLKRLQTDRVDCWQLHHLDEFSELDEIFAPGGAIEAVERARKSGLIRFVGITGHSDPAVLEEALKRYPFDQVLMAMNAADKHINSFQETLLPACVKMGVGIVAMKVFSRGAMFAAPLTAEDCLRWVMGLPVSTILAGISNIEQLERNVSIGNMPPMEKEEMASFEAACEPHATEMLFFRKDGNADSWDAYKDIHVLPQQVL
jgi:predicted aldo/keto reductase-like oxidoreductase